MIENKTVEFKREYLDNIKYTILAFANTDGGTLYIGMEDDGAVVGVEHVDDTLLRLSNMVRDTICPNVTLFIDYEVRTMEGKNVIVAQVQRGTARPYYLCRKGVRPEGVYVRQGASSVPATKTAILSMIKETSGDCYEEARSLNQALTFDVASAYFKKKGLPFGEAQKRTLGLIGGDGTYSNLAMLLSDECVHTIKMAVFEGSEKTIFHDRKELSGSLLGQLEEAYAYVDGFNRTRAEFVGLERIDKRDYPPEALREALLNAIVHRDYSLPASTLLSIFDDRIEIVTVGGLLRGMSFDDLALGVSMLRNRRLANVFYRLHLIEAYGTGLLKINECYKDFPKKPKIEVSTNAFKLTLYNTNFKETAQVEPVHTLKPKTKEEREAIILAMLRQKPCITRKDIETALNISSTAAITTIQEMITQGLLQKEGRGRNTCYRLNK